METAVIDDIDRAILDVLLDEARITMVELAVRVDLGPSATTERVRRLERDGIIAGYRAVLAADAVGRPLEARVAVTLEPGLDPDAIVAGFAAEPAIVDAVHLTGPDDHELTLRCRDTDELDEVLVRLKQHRGVVRSQTRIVLSRSVHREPRPTRTTGRRALTGSPEVRAIPEAGGRHRDNAGVTRRR